MSEKNLLTVEVVSPEQLVWSGEASMVSARTIEGEIGILPNHAPLIGVLADGTVTIKVGDGSTESFAISGGFISVSNNRVSVLGETRSV